MEISKKSLIFRTAYSLIDNDNLPATTNWCKLFWRNFLFLLFLIGIVLGLSICVCCVVGFSHWLIVPTVVAFLVLLLMVLVFFYWELFIGFIAKLEKAYRRICPEIKVVE